MHSKLARTTDQPFLTRFRRQRYVARDRSTRVCIASTARVLRLGIRKPPGSGPCRRPRGLLPSGLKRTAFLSFAFASSIPQRAPLESGQPDEKSPFGRLKLFRSSMSALLDRAVVALHVWQVGCQSN